MKTLKCVVIALISLALTTGCSISKKQLDTGNSLDVRLKIIITDKTPSGFLNATDDYSELYKNVRFDFITIKDDGDYLQKVLKEENKDAVTAIALSGQKDVSFLYNDLESLPSYLTTANIEKAVPISLYGCGIYYNDQIFKATSVDSNMLNTFDGLKESVAKIEEKKQNIGLDHVVCSQMNLEEFATLIDFKEGAVEKSVINYLSLTDANNIADPSRELNDRKSAIYIGSSRYLTPVFNSSLKDAVKFKPLFYINKSTKLYECDYLGVSSKASEPQKKALYGFLDWLACKSEYLLSPFTKEASTPLESQILESYKNGRMEEGGLSRQSHIYSKTLSENIKKLQLGTMSFEDFNESLKTSYRIGENIN